MYKMKLQVQHNYSSHLDSRAFSTTNVSSLLHIIMHALTQSNSIWTKSYQLVQHNLSHAPRGDHFQRHSFISLSSFDKEMKSGSQQRFESLCLEGCGRFTVWMISHVWNLWLLIGWVFPSAPCLVKQRGIFVQDARCCFRAVEPHRLQPLFGVVEKSYEWGCFFSHDSKNHWTKIPRRWST